jgi:hypothetical protein
LVDRGYGEVGKDFLTFSKCGVVDHIVTNPPYSLAQEFIETALSASTGKVAMLLKLAFLEGEKRRKMFQSTPLARVHVFSKRLKLTRNGDVYKNGGMIAFAWFVWEHGCTHKAEIDWI